MKIDELPSYYSGKVRGWWRKAMSQYENHEIACVSSPCGTLKRWRCRKPGTITYGFDVIQSDSTLIICGDIGDLVIGRGRGSINWLLGSFRDLSYVSEKCDAGKVDDYDEDIARKNIEEWLKEREDPDWLKENDATDIDSLSFESEQEYYNTMIDELENDEPLEAREYTCQFIYCVAAGVWLANKVLGGES